MPRPPKNTALLLFTRTPEEEVRFKKLVPQYSIARQKAIVAKLIQESEKVLAQTGLPYFTYTCAEQSGTTFAEKLYNAFKDIFARGYEQVIVIGNDCPAITPLDILLAANALHHQGIVVGPDNSGGVYLFGLSRTAFSTCTSFAAIRWSTNQVIKDIAALFNLPPETISLLDRYDDINTPQDFQNALRDKTFRARVILFFKYLLGLLTSFGQQLPNFNIQKFLFSPNYFRGPPIRLCI